MQEFAGRSGTFGPDPDLLADQFSVLVMELIRQLSQSCGIAPRYGHSLLAALLLGRIKSVKTSPVPLPAP
ncbi:hypothetical protein CQ018_10665 [Arthrobacter sp. MYb227]|nr:hypothetical protein CQ018_10665 [Arthrobacter sp. MYb227]